MGLSSLEIDDEYSQGNLSHTTAFVARTIDLILLSIR